MPNIQAHKHKGSDSPRIDARDLIGPAIVTADFQVSARNLQPSIIQRGTYTLAANVKFQPFPQNYATTTALQVLLTSNTTNPQFIDSIVVSGFTVSGSGTDTGRWLSIGFQQ